MRSLILLGFLLRLIFALNSHHIYHPDEIFQSLEVSHRLVYGFGIIPWDYVYGLRSFVVPLLFSLPLALLKAFGFTQPAVYVPVIKLLLILFSLVLIPAAYHLTLCLTSKRRLALLSGFIMAVWYELVYFSPRLLTEVLATYLLGVAVLLYLNPKPRFFWLGLLTTTAFILRPQYLPALTLTYLFYPQKFPLKLCPFSLGAVSSIVVFGFTDWITYGVFFIHLFNNINLSFLSGLSREFGTSPWWYYPYALTLTSGSLFILIIKSRYRFLIFLLLLTHSLIPHKEYRFIFLVIPLYLVTIAPVLDAKMSQLSFLLVSGLSLLGVFYRLPYESQIYTFPPLFKDPALSLQKNGEAIYFPDRHWVYTGGSYLHHVPRIYSLDYPPDNPSSDTSVRTFSYLKNYLDSYPPQLKLSWF